VREAEDGEGTANKMNETKAINTFRTNLKKLELAGAISTQRIHSLVFDRRDVHLETTCNAGTRGEEIFTN